MATTMMKFIDDRHNDPRDRLELMLELATQLLPGTEVYKLYDLILSTCADPPLAYMHLSVVAVLADPLPVSQISELLGPGQGRDIEKVLVQLWSIIDLPTNSTLPVNIYHSSVRDYVSHHSNCCLPQDGHAWELSGGVLCQAMQSQSGLTCIQFPCKIKDIPKWKWTIDDFGFRIRDFTIDTSQDLIVALEIVGHISKCSTGGTTVILILWIALMVNIACGDHGCPWVLQDQRALNLHRKICVEYKKTAVTASQKRKDHVHNAIAAKALKEKLCRPPVSSISPGDACDAHKAILKRSVTEAETFTSNDESSELAPPRRPTVEEMVSLDPDPQSPMDINTIPTYSSTVDSVDAALSESENIDEPITDINPLTSGSFSLQTTEKHQTA
ncbi:hypothetical protein EV702DRAFT_1234788 [Suillus placidus]|uniref:Uncharacterized protein n=1 Tax=Suillus placidus TaxID=48579 RepID=A0A9P6ZS03_9AGAM|nr:hypothetical protein EV702DRAFT_1234788 [Suillus placidus]